MHQKSPKHQAAGQRGAEARKEKQEALLEQLRSVKAKLQQADSGSSTTVSPKVAAPSEPSTEMECRTPDVSPWLYWGAATVLVAAAVYIWVRGRTARTLHGCHAPEALTLRAVSSPRVLSPTPHVI